MYAVIVTSDMEVGGVLIVNTRMAAEELADALENMNVEDEYEVIVKKGSTLAELINYITRR